MAKGDAQITKLVAKVLKENIESRDDDNILMIIVWDLQGLKPETRYSSFRKKFLKRTIAMPKSIERTRRELQEKHEELRGELYDIRNKAEKLEDKSQLKFEFDETSD